MEEEKAIPSKSIGESRVRTEFNPSQDGLVDQLKQKTAELINLVGHAEYDKTTQIEGCPAPAKPDFEGERKRLISLARTSYEEAAMWAVKAATA